MTPLNNIDIPNNPAPIAIIGAGGIVHDAHLPQYAKYGLEVAAIYDRDIYKADKLAKKFDIPVVSHTLDELIQTAQEKKCVFDLALPASAHLGVLSQLPPGSSVLMQKPMGEDLTQAQAILKLCQEKELLAGVNFQLRHAPAVAEIKHWIDSGKLGTIHDIDVKVTVNTPWHLWEFMKQLERLEILYHSIHYLDTIRYLAGEPKGVMASATRHPNNPGLAATKSSIILDYGDYFRANINTNHGHHFDSQYQESYLKVEGTKGAMRLKIGVNLNYPVGEVDELEAITEQSKTWESIPLSGSWFTDSFIGPMAGLLAKHQNKDSQFINSAEDAIHTMELVEKCYQSDASLRSQNH